MLPSGHQFFYLLIHGTDLLIRFNPLTYGRGQICPLSIKRARTHKVLLCQKFEKLCIPLLGYKLSFSLQVFLQNIPCLTANCEQKLLPRDFSDRWGAKTYLPYLVLCWVITYLKLV